MANQDDVRRNAEQYFAALQRFDLDGVAACFTEDAFYSHPSYVADGKPREEARGREALVTMLRDRRGNRPTVQKIQHVVVDGDIAYLEGEAFDSEGNLSASWISSARVTPGGLFSSYANYASRPPVGVALEQGEQAQNHGAG
jgi:ketosteroid isomerase-like protein